jgi:hypothetical protein
MSEYKINHFDVINLHPPIRSKLSYLAGSSLHMDIQPSNPIRLIDSFFSLLSPLFSSTFHHHFP